MIRNCSNFTTENLIEYKKFTDFPRGTMYDILKDEYSYDKRNQEIWDTNWKESLYAQTVT